VRKAAFRTPLHYTDREEGDNDKKKENPAETQRPPFAHNSLLGTPRCSAFRYNDILNWKEAQGSDPQVTS
jgi:hypothetical protein